MRFGLIIVVAAFSVAASSSCTTGGGEDELRRLLERDRTAHLEADASLLVRSLADTVWNLEAAVIRPAPRSELEAVFRSYFEGATYYRTWDDLEPPVIRVSGDGSMAWVARRVSVDRDAPAFGGGTERQRFESAWTATYAYSDGAWRMTSVTSTFAEMPSAARIVEGTRRALRTGDDPWPAYVRFRAEAIGPGGEYEVTYASGSDGSARLEFTDGVSAGIGRTERWLVQEPSAAPAPLSDTVETFLRGHDILLNLIDPETRYGPLKYAGIEPFGGQPALRIDGLDALGAPVQLYYATTDTLPLGYRVLDHMDGGTPVITTVSDWTAQDGFLWPRAARFVQGSEAFDYRVVSIVTADDADEAAFLPGTRDMDPAPVPDR